MGPPNDNWWPDLWDCDVRSVYGSLKYCKVIRVNTHKPNKNKPALNINKDR